MGNQLASRRDRRSHERGLPRKQDAAFTSHGAPPPPAVRPKPKAQHAYNFCTDAGAIGTLELVKQLPHLTNLLGPVDVKHLNKLAAYMGKLWKTNVAGAQHALDERVSSILDDTAKSVYEALDEATDATLVALYTVDLIVAFLANDMYKDADFGPGPNALPTAKSICVDKPTMLKYVLRAHEYARAVVPPIVQVVQLAKEQQVYDRKRPQQAKDLLKRMIWGLTSSTYFPDDVHAHVKEMASALANWGKQAQEAPPVRRRKDWAATAVATGNSKSQQARGVCCGRVDTPPGTTRPLAFNRPDMRL